MTETVRTGQSFETKGCMQLRKKGVLKTVSCLQKQTEVLIIATVKFLFFLPLD